MQRSVEQTLEEIGAGERPRLLVLNKVDLLDEEARDELRLRHPDAVLVSGATRRGAGGAGRAHRARAAAHAAPGRAARALRRRRQPRRAARGRRRDHPRGHARGRARARARARAPGRALARFAVASRSSLSGRRRCRRARRGAGARAASRGSPAAISSRSSSSSVASWATYQSTSPSSFAIAARRSSASARRRRRGSPSWRARPPRRPRPPGRAPGRTSQASRGYSAVRRESCWYSESSTAADPRRGRGRRRAGARGAVCVTSRRAARASAQTPAARRALRCVASSSASSSGAELAGLDAERARDQPVGEPHVLGQQRAVQVGADRVAARAPSRPLRPSLPWPRSTRPRGCWPGPRRVRPPWFSKPASTRPPRRSPVPASVDLDRDVADQARPVLAHRAHVEQARRPRSPPRRACRSARAAGSRRTRRAPPPRGAAAACSAARLFSIRSSAHSRWSRSWPPPR